ncbi:DUF2206 domain-containing protein [Actinocorallia sp. API 0066]|uniref:DUF2206 domain-containing protein n=1 Tax=Actinocorallia sp. API 0066 TaxID=2896846 RepID=UPI001E41A522|nr:DUF2206 domain-containing protein [Actinocorallia sp. API 0066]MCD0450140.1 DUF2206 domain-containing protein [Actinocorallia sp. API 0066]
MRGDPTRTVPDLLDRSPLETIPDLPVVPPRGDARRTLYRYAGLIIAIDVLVVARDLWAAQIVLLPLLFTVPGLLLLRALRVPGTSIAAFPLYVPTASVMTLLASGLAVNFVGPVVGVDAPLRALPLLVGLQFVLGGLLLAGARAPDATFLDWKDLPGTAWLLLPPLVPLLAAIGALRLNTGHDNTIAVVSIVVCLLLLVVSTASADRMTHGQLSIMLVAVALAMMWSFSLRSELVYGFDIATEYGQARRTYLAGVWEADHSTDAYGAMLSITLMPAQLHALTGMSEVVVLKLVYPILFALFPVGVFRLADRFLPTRWAYLAATYALVQGGIFQQLPALARQEIALLLFAAVLGAVFDHRVSGRQRAALIAVFAPGMIISHYSTAYLAAAVFAGALVMQGVVSVVKRKRAVNLAVLAAFVASLGAGVVWYGFVTHSASNLSQFSGSISAGGLKLLPNADGGNIISGYLKGTETSGISVADYQVRIDEQYTRYRKYVEPFEDAGEEKYELKAKPADRPPVLVPALRGVLNLGELLAQQLGNLLALLGALFVVFRRKSPGAIRVVGLLAVPALLMLMLFRVSGTFASAYNQGRAQLQVMILLVVPLFWVLYKLVQRLHRFNREDDELFLDRLFRTTSALALLTIFLNTTGFVGAFFGGGTSTNLTAKGEDFTRFYMREPELAGARWMGPRVARKELVYADRYATLRIYAETTITDQLHADITPRTLHQTGWIYASHANVVDGRVRSLVDNKLTIYAFPELFVDDHYNKVYANGYSAVYRR